MKGRLVLLACAAVSLFLVGVASGSDDLLEFQSAVDALHQVDPSLDPPPSSGGDYVVGGADVSFFLAGTTAITAHSGPLGEDPRGIWVGAISATQQPPPTSVGVVRCVAVAGNLAAVGVEITGGPAFGEGTPLIVLVRDSGLSGGTGDGIDFLSEVPAEDCLLFVGDAAGVPPINHGNFVVHDELP